MLEEGRSGLLFLGPPEELAGQRARRRRHRADRVPERGSVGGLRGTRPAAPQLVAVGRSPAADGPRRDRRAAWAGAPSHVDADGRRGAPRSRTSRLDGVELRRGRDPGPLRRGRAGAGARHARRLRRARRLAEARRGRPRLPPRPRRRPRTPLARVHAPAGLDLGPRPDRGDRGGGRRRDRGSCARPVRSAPPTAVAEAPPRGDRPGLRDDRRRRRRASLPHDARRAHLLLLLGRAASPRSRPTRPGSRRAGA